VTSLVDFIRPLRRPQRQYPSSQQSWVRPI